MVAGAGSLAIRAVGVVVPVHDEAALLPGCLAALDRALATLPGHLARLAVIVLDACSDASVEIASRWVGAQRSAIVVHERNVGAARARGMRHALDALPGELHEIWLATTDADSEVPSDWLLEQLRFARDGAEAVAGTVQVTDWNGYPIGFGERFVQLYEPPGSGDQHGHVHGANLGVRADAYVSAGGFAALATGEDHALWRALHARPRVSSRRLAVTTSARRVARAPEGFSGFLAALEDD